MGSISDTKEKIRARSLRGFNRFNDTNTSGGDIEREIYTSGACNAPEHY